MDNSKERHSVIHRLLPWLPCILALVAIIFQHLHSRNTPLIRNIAGSEFIGLYAMWLFPMVIGAVFYHYNQRRIIHWLLIAFLGGNFLLWMINMIDKCVDIPSGLLVVVFGTMQMYLLLALPNIIVLVAIFCLWFGVNVWEILTND